MFLMGFLGKSIAAVRERAAIRFATMRKWPGQRNGVWSMEFKEYDFIRNPVVQNEVFFLQSQCGACGFSVLVRSLEELIDHEKLHRTQCSQSNAAA
jgi:hypothetical protein